MPAARNAGDTPATTIKRPRFPIKTYPPLGRYSGDARRFCTPLTQPRRHGSAHVDCNLFSPFNARFDGMRSGRLSLVEEASYPDSDSNGNADTDSNSQPNT